MPVQQFEHKTCQTTCPYCGVGCGVDVTMVNNVVNGVNGSEQHPANYGKLCVKGSNLHETLDLEGRLLTPEINAQPVDWDLATDTIAEKFNQIIAKHGPDSVAFYVSGQILTEDYYVANKLMKGYIGSANIDTNSRLCMSSAVAGYKRAFGADAVPCSYSDLSNTDLLVLVGSNAAWTHPVLFQRMEKAKQENSNLKVIVIDPRKTATAELADLFLPLKIGSDVALFSGLLNYLIEHDAIDQEYINDYCENWQVTASQVSEWTVTKTAEYCQLPVNDLLTYFNAFAQSPSAITFYSQGVNQSSQGVDKCNAIINCHLATGKVGKTGSGPFSITGQPNAMGGREVGGLANMLAAHMNIEDQQHRDIVQEFWQSPSICHTPGTKAVDMFEQIEQGKIKAVWIMATNPMVSLPNRNQVEKALQKCEFVVASDCMADNDTLRYAHVKLPATTWGEKNGTVTNSERRISRQRGLLPMPGEAKHDWQIICEVAQKMGFANAFDYQSPHQIFAEHAALSGFKNNPITGALRAFDISALSQISEADYDKLKPVQWPVNAKYPNGCQQLFANNLFFTPSRKAQFIAVTVQAPKQSTNDVFPLALNSGRVRDHWHTMTRTGKASSLAKHIKEPFLSINPEDAALYAISDGQLVKVNSPFGDITLPAQFDEGIATGTLFAPIHWNQITAPSANVAKCFGSYVDPISGQPESKFTVVNVKPIQVQQHAQVFSKYPLKLDIDYWAKVRISSGYEYICAMQDTVALPMRWSQQATELSAEWSYFENSQSGIKTVICIENEKLQYVGFFAQYKPEINTDWVEKLFALNTITVEQINRVLRADVEPDFKNGKTICSCFKVGENQIIDAIVEHGDNSVEKLGQRLKCGTNCGSCKSELKTLIKQHGVPQKQPSRFEHHAIPVTEI
ncbi:MAG: nitrate reductase [Gammaproteobacteria bacterium]|nr:nitrate reductase [Gammaproteobacteria bacterium]